jgi:hypothetical protein
MRHEPFQARAERVRRATRRTFLSGCAYGIGQLALSSLLAADEDGQRRASSDPLAPRSPHHRPRARRVLFLHMAGAPSQIDLFDPKPLLARYDRQPIPESYVQGERFAFIKGTPRCLASPYRCEPRGASGQVVSELLPHTAGVADRIAVVRSMRTAEFNHAPGQLFLHTGHARAGRPSMGSWATWGLGSENRDLPAFVVLVSGRFAPDGGASLWSSAFLPTLHQGVRLRSQGDAVLFLSDPAGMPRASRRAVLDALCELDRRHLERSGDPEVETRIEQYELAFRMQASVPELLRIDDEPESIRALYGVEPGKVSFANNALLARRLLERGVRFVQLHHWGWDSHGTSPDDDIVTSLPERCRETDRACAALIRDLEARGLLEDTLVIWGGEFGRTPMNEARNGSTYLGRDHHPHAFTIWLAGGGIRPGVSLGATDEFGYRVSEDPVSVHDLHATMLHLLGVDHERLTHRFQGRDYRLTDVAGVVVEGLLA